MERTHSNVKYVTLVAFLSPSGIDILLQCMRGRSHSNVTFVTTISPKRITPQAQKTKSRSNGKIKEFRNHLWSSTAAQKQENSTSSFNRVTRRAAGEGPFLYQNAMVIFLKVNLKVTSSWYHSSSKVSITEWSNVGAISH